MTELQAPGDAPPPYMIFVVVFLFFITGLLGFLICHLLKKKGYSCRAGDMDDEEEEEKLGENADDEDEENQDTVEQILKCIIENEANMEAFNEMLGNRNVCVRHDPRLRKESIGGIPPHHHTVHSGTEHNSCHLCNLVRSKKGRRQSRTPRYKQRPGEQTVFSVGRFRVIHTDKKPHGGPNALVGSGDQLDQSQDSEEHKDVEYNLRSLFKDVRPPSENSNGTAPNVGKRRKSVTLFGLRRGSDPSGIKAPEETGREAGGIRFTIQKQPVVLEEPLLTKKVKDTPESGTKPGSTPETKTTKRPTPASPQHGTDISSSVNSQTSQADKQARNSSSVPKDGSTHGPSPEPHTSLTINPSDGGTGASAPSSLPIPSSASSGQTFNRTDKQDVEYNMLRNEEAYDPGPLQTSTPIAPGPGSIPGLTPVISSGDPEPYSDKGLPVTQTPPDPKSSPDQEAGFDASLALISLGSSPPSSFPIKTPSSVSSLKTPTSPLVVTPSPKLSPRNAPSDAAKTAISPTLTPSPKLPSGRAVSSQSPIPSVSFGKSTSPLQARIPSPASPKLDSMAVSPQTPPSSSPADQAPAFGSSPRLNVKSGSVTSVTSTTFTKGDMVSSPLSLKEQELEEARIPKSEEMTEMKTGILKTETLSPPTGDFMGSALSSPSDQLSKDKQNSLSPSSPLLPSSPLGSRISSVTIVKPSSDSKREFSVVTMVEKEEQSTSQKHQKEETSEFGVESGKVGASTPISGVGQPATQIEETSGAEVRSVVSQEKDDMVEMEDIRDCKVTQVEEAERVEEEDY